MIFLIVSYYTNIKHTVLIHTKGDIAAGVNFPEAMAKIDHITLSESLNLPACLKAGEGDN